ncbi:MAG: hypothetical protein JW751_00545, partial [Polyangiaceae bacterium]|nr:hypothetical protein [Polyangiaceae bacterium]
MRFANAPARRGTRTLGRRRCQSVVRAAVGLRGFGGACLFTSELDDSSDAQRGPRRGEAVSPGRYQEHLAADPVL